MEILNRYFLEISYKGTAYHGWQTQPNAIAVQEVLNKALETFFRKPIETLGCGRTDSGVHATQFYLHLDLENEILEADYSNIIKSLNGLLSYDIAIKSIHRVKANAHARFDAVSRSYQYHIHFNKNPFKTDTSWLVRDQLDIMAMNHAAAILMQYDDFGAFCKANADNFTNICKITKAEWEITENGLIFHITANRFLRNMVRAIVGTLVEVGKRKLKIPDFHLIIQSQNRSTAGASVPACGLFLTSVIYPYIK